MALTLRQKIYQQIRDTNALIWNAVFGTFSKSDGTTPGISYKVIFGDSPNLTADVAAEIWPQSGAMGRPTSAETLDVVSSSIEDDAGGTGIDLVFIEGLDGDYNPVSESIVLDGTTPVTSTNTYIHVNEINCLNATTSGTTNAGNITVTNTTSAQNLGYVVAGDSISKHGQYIVPAGYNALILSSHTSCFRTSGSGTKRCQIDLSFEPQTGAGAGIKYKTLKTGVSSAGVTEATYHVPLVVGEKVAIIPDVTAESSNTIATMQYEIILIKNTIDIDTIF